MLLPSIAKMIKISNIMFSANVDTASIGTNPTFVHVYEWKLMIINM